MKCLPQTYRGNSNKLMRAALACFLVATTVFQPTRATSGKGTATLTVTIIVPSVSQINADRSEITFDFDNFRKGAASQTQTIVYKVETNALKETNDVVRIALESELDGIEIIAMPGPFSNEGSESTAVLAPKGARPFKDSGEIALMDKIGDSQVVMGTFPITYRGVLTKDKDRGSFTTKVLVSLAGG